MDLEALQDLDSQGFELELRLLEGLLPLLDDPLLGQELLEEVAVVVQPLTIQLSVEMLGRHLNIFGLGLLLAALGVSQDEIRLLGHRGLIIFIIFCGGKVKGPHLALTGRDERGVLDRSPWDRPFLLEIILEEQSRWGQL